MNNDCAFVFPATIFPKFSSDKLSVTSAFFPAGASPLATEPDCFRSMCHAASCPAAFLSLKAKIALPLSMASFLSSGEELREDWMASKAADDGNASGMQSQYRSIASLSVRMFSMTHRL